MANSKLEARIGEIISRVALEIASVVRQDFAEEISKIVGGPIAAPAAKTPVAAAAPAKGKGKRRRRGRGAGPSDGFIDDVLKAIKANPGKRSEELAKILGRDAKPALAKLRAAKKVKTQGQLRGMTYFA